MPKSISTLDLAELHKKDLYTLTESWKGVLEEASILRLEEQGHQPGQLPTCEHCRGKNHLIPAYGISAVA
jgi:hypothetical protein